MYECLQYISNLTLTYLKSWNAVHEEFEFILNFNKVNKKVQIEITINYKIDRQDNLILTQQQIPVKTLLVEFKVIY